MNRRSILKSALVGGTTVGLRMPLAHAADYDGKVFAFVQADGGWDPTSFCDPKANTRGEPVINHWAERDEIRQAGNIPYAPFANNAAFFEKYHSRILVVNGVDAQTNSHTVGVVHNWSGRNSEGYPTTTALLAAHYGSDKAVAYLSFGGFSYPGGVIRYTRLNNPDLLRNIAEPASARFGSYFFDPADWNAIAKHSTDTARWLASRPDLPPSLAQRRVAYQASLNAEGLEAYANAIPNNEPDSRLKRQAELAVLAFRTGVAISADLWIGGFDTHSQHDGDHGRLLAELTDAVDYLWDFAETEGVADRLVVVMGSDFGRTNFYNADDGKDHWPIGSYVVMEKNQTWTDRAVGETDDLHFAQRIDPSTLERDDVNGTIIYPKHVHKALRRYLGIADSAGAQRYPFNNTEDFAFFG